MRLARLRTFLRWFYNYRSIRLTPEGTRFVFLSLAVGVAAINTGNNLLYLLLAMMLSLIVISGMLSEQCLKQLVLRRRLPEHVFANRPTTAAISITNRKRRIPTFSLRVLDLVDTVAVDRGIHLLHLPPRGSALKAYPLLIGRRGLHRLDGVRLVTPFPFGLFMKAAALPLPAEVVVYPELVPLPPVVVQECLALGSEQPVPQRGHGGALYNLRDYQAGDESRSIHWKTSARQGRLTVKEAEAEDLRKVTVVLPTRLPRLPREDRGFYEARFEGAVSLAASLVTFFHDRGYAVRLVTEDQDLECGRGESHYYQVLRTLALCAAKPADAMASPRPSGSRRQDGLTLLIKPWDDPALAPLSRTATRVIDLSESRFGEVPT